MTRHRRARQRRAVIVLTAARAAIVVDAEAAAEAAGAEVLAGVVAAVDTTDAVAEATADRGTRLDL